MGRYYEKVSSYTRKVRDDSDDDCDCEDSTDDNVDCFDVDTENIHVGW